MDRGATLVQPKHTGGDWIWADSRFCNYTRSREKDTHGRAFFECYFQEGESCPLSRAQEKLLLGKKNSKADVSHFSLSDQLSLCPKYVTDMAGRQRFRAASMEYLFSNVSRALVQAADEVAGEVFGSSGVSRDQLITVHVR